MYHYLDDKQFIRNMRAFAGKIMQQLCHTLKEDYDIGANFYLVGSGAKNLIMQNGKNPVDLDYNLEIVRCENIDDCRYLKECARKSFNKVLNCCNLRDCEDSTSSLTSKCISINNGNNTLFKIDVCITKRDKKENYERLIHKKTLLSVTDEYYWNTAPNSAKVKKKADYIKKCGKWEFVRKEYIDLKNYYLSQKNENHPSFICYIEAVNNVYNTRSHW